MALTPLKIKLPRLQIRIPIVDDKKAASVMFHRFINDLVEAIEKALNGIQDQVAAIAAAQAAAAAAQATADEALATAQAAGGSQFITISGGPPASSDASGVVVGSLIAATGAISGFTIDANASTIIDLNLYEEQGATTNLVGTLQIVATSDGTQNVDLSWNVNSIDFYVSGVGALFGTVTYILDIAYVSGALIVAMGPLSANVTITKPATP